MQEHEVMFEAYLSRKALHFTQARRLILATVFDLHEHFDIEQLYDTIHHISRDVSRATVYRTIPLLVEAGLIQRSVRGDTREKYEHIYGHPKHAHWVCAICGAVLETDLKELTDIIDKNAAIHKFRTEDISIIIRGKCWKCNKGENESQ